MSKLRYTREPKPSPDGAPIVSMIEHNGQVLLATTKGVYRLGEDDTFRPLPMVDEPAET